MAKKQKVIFVLPHTFEPFFKKIKEDIMNVKDLDHFSTRYLSFMVKSTNKYDFEFFIISSKVKKPLRVKHKNGFYIHVFPRDFPSILPLETSTSMLKEIKRRCHTKENIIWHVNSYYMIMSDPISFLLKKEKQSFALHHRGAGFSVRTLPYSIYKYWIMNPMIFKAADIVVAENRDEERKLLKNYKLDRNKVMYAPNPVEIVEVKKDKRTLRKELGLPQDKTVIVYAGRIMKGKGVTFLFNSLKPFLKKEKGIFFLMIGDGPQRPEIETALKQEGIANAKMVLWVTREVLFRYLKACDLFVHPNRNEKFEGTPNALVEAQGAGLPVVGFDIGGVRDIVKEGMTGGLEKTKDMDAFARKIVSIAKDKKKLLEMSRNSRKNYDDNYDSSKILKSYERLYGTLIERMKQKKRQSAEKKR
ncbi:MAG: glycosyltransferase family 4 protein [archaeon]